MSERFVSNWWAVRVPLGWQSEENEDCVTFFSDDGFGALQISAYRNASGLVTDDDLSEFALVEMPDARNLMNVTYGTFVGLEGSYFESESFRRVCWLRNESLLVYVTYSCSAGDELAESGIVDEALRSLEPVGLTSAGH
jgi:hypothetical protein